MYRKDSVCHIGVWWPSPTSRVRSFTSQSTSQTASESASQPVSQSVASMENPTSGLRAGSAYDSAVELDRRGGNRAQFDRASPPHPPPPDPAEIESGLGAEDRIWMPATALCIASPPLPA